MVGYGSGQKKGVSDNTDDKNLYVWKRTLKRCRSDQFLNKRRSDRLPRGLPLLFSRRKPNFEFKNFDKSKSSLEKNKK
jgi:hypothetical protein